MNGVGLRAAARPAKDTKAAHGFEPWMEDLQSSALPLGYATKNLIADFVARSQVKACFAAAKRQAIY